MLKSFFVEPRISEEFEEVISGYLDAARGTGAIMCAVYRGKVSEGMDFAGDDARGVIGVGIPYANYGELKVTLVR